MRRGTLNTIGAPGMTPTKRLWFTALVAGAIVAIPTAATASSWSVTATGTPGEARASAAPAAPGSPTSTCVSGNSNTVTVAWSAVTHASNYRVYQATASAGPFTLAATVTATTWTSSALTGAPTTYY